jgi:ATP-dependent Clp protease ATP-binding subunit ClpX
MANEILRCNVCHRASNEVRNLIAAPLKQGGEVLICDRCNGEIAEAMEAENRHRQKATVKEEPLRKPREIKAFLDQHVIAQERAKQDVAVAVYNHFKRRDRARAAKIEKAEGVEIQKSNIMLLGPSGTGKTELFRAIARMLKVPFYVADATRLTQAGYVGDDVESMLQGLLQAANGDPEKAQWGIIFIDEFDKLARKSGRGASGYRDVSGEGVQQSLLKLIEGSMVPVPRGMGKGGTVITIGADGTAKPSLDMLDTTNVLFVCAGSFDGIQETVDRRINKSSRLGFGANESTKRKLDLTDVYSAITEEDILDFGIIPELLGRLPVRTSTLPLTDTDMVRVLTEPKHSIIKQFRALFAYDNIDLVFTDDALLEIGRLAKSRPTGARALRSIVEDLLRPYSFDAPSDATIASITVTADVVKGEKAAEVTRRPLIVVTPAEATG